VNVEERKKIVAKLLSIAHAQAAKEAKIVINESNPSLEFVCEHLRKYILAKLLLSDDCTEDRLSRLVKLSLARSMKLNQSLLKELDNAAPCDNVSSASAKKILLLYAIQKDFAIRPDAAELITKTTVMELARLVHSLL
jgi:hypothetical protein